MSQAVFQHLPAPDVLLKAAPSAPTGINAHIHLPPNFSAFETAAQAVALAREQNIAVLGASNYYDFVVYETFADAAKQNGVFPLFGMEIITLDETLQAAGVLTNDPGNPGKMYVCGKGIIRFDPMSAEASGLMGTIRQRDAERMAQMTAKLADVFAARGGVTGLTADAILLQTATRHGVSPVTVVLQERHVAEAFAAAFVARVPENERAARLAELFGEAAKSAPSDINALGGEIRSRLMKAGKAAFVPETFVDAGHAFRLIGALGGVPCYPVLADGASPIGGFETPVESFVQALAERGYLCAEFIPTRNAPETLSEYVHALRGAGLVVTAGTEHNTRAAEPLAPTCKNGVPIPADVQSVFAEGACVWAAHQYLVARGEPGFADAQNVPNPRFASAGERIGYFATLGAAVIAAFHA